MFVRRFTLSLLAAILGLGMIVFPALPSHAQNDSSEQSEEVPITLEITSTGTPVLEPGADITLTYTITNNSDAALSINYIQFRAQNWTATSTQAVASWLEGRSSSYLVRGEETQISVPAGRSVTRAMRIDRDQVTWRAEEYAWGPRGVQIQVFTDTGETLTDRTMLLVAPDAELTPMPFTAVVPVTADSNTLRNSPSFLDLLTASVPTDTPSDPAELDDAVAGTSASPTAADVAQEWNFAGVSLFVDPALTSDDNMARALRMSSAEILPLPLNDADISAFAHAGIATGDVQRFVDEASAQLEGMTAPDTSQIFLPEGNVDLDSLGMARDFGMSAAIIDASTVPEATPSFFNPHAHTTIDLDGEQLNVLLTDPRLTSAVTGTLVHGDENMSLSDLDRRQVALALSAISFRDLPNAVRASAVQIPRGSVYDSDAAATRDTIAALANAPWLEPVGATSILSSIPSESERSALPQTDPNFGEFTAEDWSNMSTSLGDVANFAMIFDDSEEILQAARTHADSLVGVGWRDFPNRREINIAGIAPDPRVQSAIRIETSSTINMISETSALPIQVTNPFEFPVNVHIDLDTPDSRLVAPDPVDVRLEANSTTPVHIPVEAWGSGNITVDANVTNADGVPIGQSQEIDIRVRADWENWGTIIIAAIFGLMLVVGVVKSVRRGRRSERIDATDMDAAIKANTHSSTGS